MPRDRSGLGEVCKNRGGEVNSRFPPLPPHAENREMKILALETTEKIGSVAAMQDGRLLAEADLESTQRSAQSLSPAMMALLKQVGWQPADVQLVAVSHGPGSFTGLRVGVTAAKIFAYAVGAEVLGIDTLEVIAAGSPEDVASVSVVMDAQRGEVVAQRFDRRPDGEWAADGPRHLIDADVWIRDLPNGIAVSGPVLARLAHRLPSHVCVLDPKYWTPRAAVVARIAARDYAIGRRDDLWKLAPIYSRRSAAEEKHDKR